MNTSKISRVLSELHHVVTNAESIRDELRNGHSQELQRRRWICALCAVGVADFAVRNQGGSPGTGRLRGFTWSDGSTILLAVDTLRPAVVCVFAKPARPGEVKTRLIPTYGAIVATELAGAFFADTWHSLAALSWARLVVATTDTDPRYWQAVPSSSLWEQGDGDLGERLQRIMRRGLQEADVAIAIGADTPGLPMRLLDEARDRLESADAVLGPSDDGGFYLLALKQCPDRIFDDLVWSKATTFAATCTRLEEHGMRVSVLDRWFDVDVPEDLQRLHRRIRRGEIVAPATARVLAARVFVDLGQTTDSDLVP